MSYKLFTLLALLFISQYVLAEITVKVDRDPIVVDESFHIVYESNVKIDAKPDFSSLQNTFTVLDSRHRSNTNITNGKINYSQMWIITVIANKNGSFTIPSIRFGNETTKPSTINVVAATVSEQGSTSDDIFIDIEVDTKTPYVQAQLIYTLRLYRSVVTNNASLSEPEVVGGQAVINKLGEDNSFETVRDGKRYIVIERRYVIFPQSSGSMKIQPIVFQGQVGGTGGFFSFDPFGPQPKSIAKRSMAIDLDVKSIPDSFTGDTWLPANELKIHEQWSDDPKKLTQGEATTRTLILTAKGLAASHLPVIADKLPNELKLYPDQPEFEETNNAHGFVGVRRDKMAIIPTVAGEYTLPAVTIPWWNTSTDKMELAELPERFIKVEENAAASVSNGIQEPEKSNDNLIANLDEKEQSIQILTDTAYETSIWKWVSFALLVLWLLTLAIFWRSKRIALASKPNTELMTSSRKYLKQIQYACRNNNAVKTKQGLLDWANCHWPDKKVNSINAIKEYADQSFQIKLDELNNCLYGNSASQWDGVEFLKTFEAQSFEVNEISGLTGNLEPLYKT